MCHFANTGDDWYVLVGVARDMILNPRSVGGGFIYTYRLSAEGEKLEFVHKVGLATKLVVSFLSFLSVLTTGLQRVCVSASRPQRSGCLCSVSCVSNTDREGCFRNPPDIFETNTPRRRAGGVGGVEGNDRRAAWISSLLRDVGEQRDL